MKCKFCETETRLSTWQYLDMKYKVCKQCFKWLNNKFKSKKKWKS